MKNIYALKAELDSLVSLKELTESLNYMSAAKMMKVRAKVLETRAFLEEALKTRIELQRYIVLLKLKEKNPKKNEKKFINNQTLIIAIMTDQGLCGSFNQQLAKKILKDFVGKKAHLILVGKKGAGYFRKSNLAENMQIYRLPTKDNSSDIKVIFNQISNFGTVNVYFNKYLNAVKTDPQGYVYKSMSDNQTAQNLSKVEIKAEDIQIDDISKTFVVEPNVDEVNTYFENVISQAVFMHQMLESQLSENNSRMLAMKEASDNIVELIVKQRKLINTTRRQKINQSLSELFGALLSNN